MCDRRRQVQRGRCRPNAFLRGGRSRRCGCSGPPPNSGQCGRRGLATRRRNAPFQPGDDQAISWTPPHTSSLSPSRRTLAPRAPSRLIGVKPTDTLLARCSMAQPTCVPGGSSMTRAGKGKALRRAIRRSAREGGLRVAISVCREGETTRHRGGLRQVSSHPYWQYRAVWCRTASRSRGPTQPKFSSFALRGKRTRRIRASGRKLGWPKRWELRCAR